MFANFGKRNLSKSFQGSVEMDKDLVKARLDASRRLGAKDDMEVKPTFGDNQFWHMPGMFDDDLAELMAEAEGGEATE